MLSQSENIEEISKAFVACQPDLPVVTQGAVNEFFTTDKKTASYADYASIVVACRPILHKYDLAVTQTFIPSDAPGTIVIESTLIHKSGQYWGGVLTMPLLPEKSGAYSPQKAGSAISYAKRYAYAALLNLVTEKDDDAEGAMNRGRIEPKASTSTESTDDDMDIFS